MVYLAVDIGASSGKIVKGYIDSVIVIQAVPLSGIWIPSQKR